MKLEYAATALADLERLDDLAPGASSLITNAVDVLARHPLIGREVEEGLRELIISRGRTGYVALYDFDEVEDIVTVRAIRHQREAGLDALPE